MVAWFGLTDGYYTLSLTDGYWTLPASIARKAALEGRRLEELIAERMYRLEKRVWTLQHLPHFSPEVVSRYPQLSSPEDVPEPIHVWVLGSDRWLDAELPAPLTTICANEHDPTYRVLIIGRDLNTITTLPYLPDSPSWTYQAGMKRRKRHKHKQQVRVASATLLTPMAEYYNRTQKPATFILRQMGVPVEYIGD